MSTITIGRCRCGGYHASDGECIEALVARVAALEAICAQHALTATVTYAYGNVIGRYSFGHIDWAMPMCAQPGIVYVLNMSAGLEEEDK